MDIPVPDIPVPDIADFEGRAVNALIGVSPVTVRRRVDFGECDPAGIVYTPRFADYALSAFHWFMEVLFHDIGRAAVPEGTPMRGLELDFRKMLFPGGWFEMQVFVTGMRTRTFDLAIRCTDAAGDVVFMGRLSPISADRVTNEAVPLPRLLAERLAAYQARCVPPADVLKARLG